MRREAGAAAASWTDRAEDEARDRGSSVGGGGVAGGRLQAEERAEKEKPPQTPQRKN